MCAGCLPDNIIVCPVCRRDEGCKAGDSDSLFVNVGHGWLRRLRGHSFKPVIGNDYVFEYE